VIRGGGQEWGLRSGTENVAGIAGLGAPAARALQHLDTQHLRLAELRDELHGLLIAALGDRVHVNGHPVHRLPNTLNVSIDGTVGAELLAACPDIAASTGSACHDGSISSPVLAAMGFDPARAAAAIRLSLGADTTSADIETAVRALSLAAALGATPMAATHGGYSAKESWE
jgi:cysteine desulfurase